jgi:two-component system, NtrC family, sensor kinase
LNTKEQSPKLHQFSKIFIGLSILIFILVIPGQFIPALIIGQAGILFMAIFFLYAGIVTFRQGYPPAKYYLVAWSFLILGIIVEILATVNLSPNLYYTNTMQLGSAFEVALLSFALADRINLYKKQREKSQQALVAQTQENERIVREQNVFLEHKVQERTGELNVSLETLRNTQMKLVENEKMASLGVLTAGIAHEINNPINFIASSLNPLKRNLETLSELLDKYDAISQTHEAYPSIEAFKEEIDYEYTCEETNLLLTSISEGAERTTAIVKGLRNFSRLDEGERKKVDLNEGLESTLMLLQSNIRQKDIETVSSFGPLPETLCFPGQLNQVFMNILTNAIQAMSNKGILTVQSEFDPTLAQIRIRVSDTGKGMSEAVMQKIFDPFFTTKAVGEGTGLGLSISYGIIQKHQGTIKVESEVGKGSTFWIVLPVQH